MLTMLFEMMVSLGLVCLFLSVILSFISKTFIGKSIILIYKIMKMSFKLTYLTIKKSYNMVSGEVAKFEKKAEAKKPKSSKKKEVVSKKVVNLEDYRNKK